MTIRLERLKHALAPAYEVSRAVGEGGMATVYLAEDLRHGRPVAVKVLNAPISSAAAIERFKKEIGFASRLVHPHIVPLIDSGQADGLIYYLMPYVEGETLRDRLWRQPRLTPDEAFDVASNVADALNFAHSRGVLHRDIKPENILLTAGHALLTDFGVARALEAAAGPGLTQEGVILGTPQYMSPEQIGGDETIDARSDLYSLGCVLFEMLTLEPPFAADSARAVMASHVSRAPKTLADYGLSVEGAQPILDRALAKDRGGRYGSAAEMLADMRNRMHLRARPVRTPVGRLAARMAPWALLVSVVIGILSLVTRGMGEVGGKGSIAVLPVSSGPTLTPADSLAADVAEEVTRQINRWEDVIAVPSVSLSGARFDLGLRGRHTSSTEEGRRVAREVGAGRLATVSVGLRGDSVWVTLTVASAAGTGAVERPLVYGGTAKDLPMLAAVASAHILGLRVAAAEFLQLHHFSRSPDAIAAFDDGRRLLDQSRLGEAESRFRTAIQIDSAFAYANHYLALTLYWRGVEAPRDRSVLAPDIVRLASTARRQGSALPENARDHIDAFYLFQLGEYEGARAAYSRLLRRDSTDAYAWLLLGSLELADPWLAGERPVRFTPRSDLNVALRAFKRTVRLSPDFHLGYAQLLDLYERIESGVDNGAAIGFERPRDELIAPWTVPTPYDQRAFVPVALDSIQWVTREERERLVRDELLQGLERLEREVTALLERWARYGSDAAAPHEAMRDWLASRLARLADRGTISRPERLDSVLLAARHHASEALNSVADTVARDRLRYAQLDLALGNMPDALRQTEAAVRGGLADADKAFAVNVFMATGRVAEALRLAEARNVRRYVPVTGTERVIAYGPGDRIVDRVRVLAAMGVGGRPLEEAMAQLTAVWNAPDYEPSDQALLRLDAAPFVLPALALDRRAVIDWVKAAGDSEPMWLLWADTAARPNPELLLGLVLDDRRPRARERAFLGGLLAQRWGDYRLAAQLFSRLDSLPVVLGGMDVGWGYRTLSLALRADSYAAAGDTVEAVRNRSRFKELWLGADSTAGSAVLVRSSTTRAGIPAAQRR